MRNAALTLGVIAGLLGLIVGFFGYGYTVFIESFGEIGDLARQVENPERTRIISLLAPILAIAGGAMARAQNVVGGLMMLVSCAGMYWGFGFNVFTMFPIAMCGLGGVLALAARRPDPA
ncbi:hypothetical protein [Rhodovulum steppense]|uniref:Uncharacterized protein n=1 Tax=Rhodovulum steppense TaxID=540251 RepID=A0A4R1YU12_9RHOB|nr:hypothetical protein [Rhodovulum steppense]TCM84572.1 hypothetical protein EV216_11153 [Rhodovulum steppense]